MTAELLAAHAWGEADGRRVGEPAEAYAYRVLLAVPRYGTPDSTPNDTPPGATTTASAE
jgi:hypothetical protein